MRGSRQRDGGRQRRVRKTPDGSHLVHSGSCLCYGSGYHLLQLGRWRLPSAQPHMVLTELGAAAGVEFVCVILIAVAARQVGGGWCGIACVDRQLQARRE